MSHPPAYPGTLLSRRGCAPLSRLGASRPKDHFRTTRRGGWQRTATPKLHFRGRGFDNAPQTYTARPHLVFFEGRAFATTRIASLALAPHRRDPGVPAASPLLPFREATKRRPWPALRGPRHLRSVRGRDARTPDRGASGAPNPAIKIHTTHIPVSILSVAIYAYMFRNIIGTDKGGLP